MEKIIRICIIYLLIFVLIVFLLSIAFYEYKPKVALSEIKKYTRTEQTSSTIQEINTSEIADVNNRNIIKSYAITSCDLTAYKLLDIYDESRPDPFSGVLRSAEYNTSISGTCTDVLKNNQETNNSKDNNNTNSTGYFQSSSKTK